MRREEDAFDESVKIKKEGRGYPERSGQSMPGSKHI
jgi:hypothetical protein